MAIVAIILTAVVAALLYFVLIVKGRKQHDPPTPGWLPIIGSLPYLPKAFEEYLCEHFGDKSVITLYMGLDKMYCLNNYDAIKEALLDQGDKFSSRPTNISNMLSLGESGGIVFANGEQWREYRRFALKTLRDLGFGRQGSEQVIISECQQLCDRIDGIGNDVGISTSDLFGPAISNVICELVFGSRLASEERDFKMVLDLMRTLLQSQNDRRKNFTLILMSKYFIHFPFILKLLSSARSKQIGAFMKLVDFCKKQAEKHRQEWQESSEPRDFIDAHLQHQQVHAKMFNDARLALSIVDLFVAGTDTTSHTLRWGILHMIANPEVSDRVFQEIVSIIGTERQVTMKDKSQMHYTLAALEEIHRFASLASTAVPHMTNQTATVDGFTIPSDSLVIYNIYAIHNSPKHFPDPQKFKPERYLDDEGRFHPSDYVIPFGVGKRACLGESLARMELFLFFVTLMQRYRFSIGTGDVRGLSEIMKKGCEGSGLRAPLEHNVVFSRR